MLFDVSTGSAKKYYNNIVTLTWRPLSRELDAGLYIKLELFIYLNN
jgi:hypothetical protein